jgi:PhoH-like ATPase
VVKLSAWAHLAGKIVVIYFYPKDSTPGCTTEAQQFRDLHAQFVAADTVFSAFLATASNHTRTSRASRSLPFELGSDSDEAVCTLFGVMKMKNMYGKQVRGIERSTFVIDSSGVLRREWRGVKVPGHAQEVLDFRQNSLTQPKAHSMPRKPAATKKPAVTKIFVLDTNVLMHDPSSLFRFEEHDVFLPIMTLEELDNNKKGMSEIARNARQTSRMLDELLGGEDVDIDEGVDLYGPSSKLASGRLYLQTEAISAELPQGLPTSKVDNQILSVVIHLQKKFPKRPVILVSKDINMRIKSRALNLLAEDYFNDKVLEDTDILYTGTRALPENFWDKHGKGMESWKKEAKTYYKINGPLCPQMLINECVWLEKDGFTAIVKEAAGKTAVLETLVDYTHPKNAVWGITARNREQNFAMNLLMNPDIDFVTLLGQAGTGKTLLTLAAGLNQVLENKLFAEIIMTRATVPVGEDIGFLPGTEEEKMAPWMGALEDNLDVLTHTDEKDSGPYGGEWGKAATHDIIRSRIKVKSMNFMRGRTFLKKYLIIDEAQNLTPKQMKTLITRAGPGTKVVCLGNIAQIDTPYLTEGSSGLTYVVDRFKGWAHSGHITLQRGERSRLADHAAEVL